MFERMLSGVLMSLLLAGTALALENEDVKNSVTEAQPFQEEVHDQKIPDQVTSEHWAYREIADLLEKYSTHKKLPVGKSCSKGELAQCLLSVLDKVVEKYEKEG